MILNKRGLCWLFVSAYTPLFVVLIIKMLKPDILSKTDGLTLITILILIYVTIGSLLFVNQFLKRSKNLDSYWMKVKIEETKNEDYVLFIMTYLVPFFGLDMDISNLIALFVLFLIIGYIYINSSLFSVNPVLNIIWNYNIYRGQINGVMGTILSKEPCKTTDKELKLIIIAENIYINKENEDEKGDQKNDRRKLRGIFEKFEKSK